MGYTQGMRTLILITLAISSVAWGETFGRERTVRAVATSRYEVAISKAGRVDVYMADGARFIEDAWAGVQLAGQAEPRRIKLDARHSQRDTVSTKLGQGKALTLGGDNFLYGISSYETQPFLTLRMGYTNDTKKPQVVERMVVLAADAGQESGLMLGGGAEQARIITSVAGGACESVPVAVGAASGFGQLAVWHPGTGRMLIAGFLGAPRSAGRFSLDMRTAATDAMGGAFSIEWHPSEPVRVEPGQRLELPPLYLCVAGGDPVEELRRFGRALGIIGETPPVESCVCDEAAIGQLARLAFLPAPWRPRCDRAGIAPESAHLALLDLMEQGPAVPLDMFDEGTPRVWRATASNAAGNWALLLLFNDGTEPRQQAVPLPPGFSTVFDYSQQHYLGTAEGSLTVEVLPGEARVLGLRPYAGRPMLIAAAHHGAAGVVDEIVAHAYDEDSGTLSVESRVTEPRRLEYHLLLPEGVTVARVKKSQGEADYTLRGRVVTVALYPAEAGTVQWSLETRPGDAPEPAPVIRLAP